MDEATNRRCGRPVARPPLGPKANVLERSRLKQMRTMAVPVSFERPTLTGARD